MDLKNTMLNAVKGADDKESLPNPKGHTFPCILCTSIIWWNFGK